MNSPDPPPFVGPIAELVRETADAIARQYQIGVEEAREIVAETFASRPELLRVAETEDSAARIRRTRACKDAVAEAKRRVYYHLRRYRAADDFAGLVEQLEALGTAEPVDEQDRRALAIAGQHKSTAERLPALDEFHRQLLPHLADARTILDLGCGVYPLVFPFDACPRLERYVAADKDPLAIRAVRACAAAKHDERLVAVDWEIGAGWDRLVQDGHVSSFDVALMLKLVPVVHRQERESLPALAQCPARTWVLSGSCTSLTKRHSIQRREKAVLRRFVESAGRQVTDEFAAGSEFVWVSSIRRTGVSCCLNKEDQ